MDECKPLMVGDLSAGRLLPEGDTPAAAAITAWPNYIPLATSSHIFFSNV